MKDIADESGVSISTVSRVLNGKTRINSDTKNKIYSALNRLNAATHDPTKIAANRNILVITANLSHLMHFKVIDAINETAEERGYRVIIELTNNRLLSFDELYERVKENNVCGIIILALMAKLRISGLLPSPNTFEGCISRDLQKKTQTETWETAVLQRLQELAVSAWRRHRLLCSLWEGRCRMLLIIPARCMRLP